MQIGCIGREERGPVQNVLDYRATGARLSITLETEEGGSNPFPRPFPV